MKHLVKQKTSTGTINLELMEKEKNAEGKWKQHRIHLGVLSPDGNELLKSSRFPELSPEVLALLKSKGVGYIGGKAPARGRRATPGSRYSTKTTAFPKRIIEVGETRVLRKLCDECGFTDALLAEESFGHDAGIQLLYLAIWQACTGEAQHMAGDWLARHELPQDFPLQDVTSGALSAFMRWVDDNEAAQQAFQKKWIAACGFPDAIVYDTTVFFTYSGRLVMAEYEYDHDEGLPRYNFTMAMDGRRMLPLIYRILPGSVTDVVTLAGTTEALRRYGLRSVLLSTDKGFYSNDNVAYCLDGGLDILCGVPLVSSDAKKLREEYYGLLDDTRNQTVYGGCRIGAIMLAWNIKMADGSTRGVDVWLSRNFTIASARAENLLEKLEATDGVLKGLSFSSDEEYDAWLSCKDDSTRERLKKYYVKAERNFWRIVENDSSDASKEIWSAGKPRSAFLHSVAGLSFPSEQECKDYLTQYEEQAGKHYKAENCMGFALERNHEAINETIRFQGISLHVTSRRMDIGEFIEKTYARGGIETMFDMIKNDNGQDRFRSGCSKTASGSFFLAFLAAIVRQVFGNKVRQMIHHRGVKSIDDALRQLQLIRMVEYSSGKRCLVEIPCKTRKMLQALNIIIHE